MRPVKFEKLVRMATFEELWASRKPDYRAKNEIRTLKRHGIFALTTTLIVYLLTRKTCTI